MTLKKRRGEIFFALRRWMPCGVTTAQGRKIFRPYAGTVPGRKPAARALHLFFPQGGGVYFNENIREKLTSSMNEVEKKYE
jgi:hypothetical protein